ncbi:nitroreductase family protein [Varibaculum cambriense]|uniref:nitroreductase family protein n=1 Tax=Varibaculum cambriense TaxID=184870 RepID=UPI0024B51A8D
MKTLDLLRNRRSRYQLNREIPLSHQELLDLIDEVTAQVPDAFNMQSQRLLVVTGDNQDALWNRVLRFSREKFRGKRLILSGLVTALFSTFMTRQ